MAKLNLSPPWIILYEEMKAFFRKDKSVNVGYDDSEKTIKLYVKDGNKAAALQSFLKEEVDCGNVKVAIEVVPANGKVCKCETELKDVFIGNGAFDHIETVNAFGFTFRFVVFVAEVVQFRTDDISDYNGLQSTLYEDIARDIFKDVPAIFYCTEPAVGAPLGEWP